MAKYKIKNLLSDAEKAVRIYRVNKEGSIVSNPQFTLLDPLGSSIGINLLPNISCIGAIDFAGVITLDDEVSGTVSNSTGSVDYSNNEELITAMEGKGFTMVELGEWIPRLPDVFYPRQSLSFINENPEEGPPTGLPEPSNLTVELTDKFGEKTIHSGKISSVMDSCRLKGILIRFAMDQFQIGCEPGTPFTKVKATFSDRQFDTTPNEDWIYSNWQNPTIVFSNNNRTITGNFGWDDLEYFWCFSEFMVSGAHGNVGDILNYQNIDFVVSGSLTDSQRNIQVNTDFTETCSWNTQNPELCRQINQVRESSDRINVMLAGRGGKIYDFNQNPVWGPAGGDGYMNTAANYRPTAIRWTPNNANYGYSIPEPELPM